MKPLQNQRKSWSRGFTLLEVVISMGILALLAGSVYAIVSSAIGASRTAMDQQLTLRRLDAFLRLTREGFLNLPAQGTVSLEIGRGQGGEAEQRLVIGKPQGIFGLPSLAGGSLVLAARSRADGSRTMTLLKIPANVTGRELDQAMNAPGIPLLPHLRKPHWSFRAGTAGANDGTSDWQDEWKTGSPRPLLVRLQSEIDDLPNPIEAVFYVPPLGSVGGATNPAQTPPQS